MTTTQTSFGLAAFVRCQHNIRLGNLGRYCASVSLNVTTGEASLFPHSPGHLAPAAFNWFIFWFLLFSPITLPALEVITNASATSVAGAIFSACVSLATAGGCSDEAEEDTSFCLLFFLLLASTVSPFWLFLLSFSLVSFFLCLHQRPWWHPPPVLGSSFTPLSA